MYLASTPEAQQAARNRQVSKDSGSVCRGVNVSTGEPCRNKLSTKPGAATSGLITRIDGQNAFYCWRHKEQAKERVLQHAQAVDTSAAQAVAAAAPRRRASMDGLIERVQAMAITNPNAEAEAVVSSSSRRQSKASRKSVVKVQAQELQNSTEVFVQQQQQATVTVHHHHHFHHDVPPPLPPRSQHKHKVITLLTGLFNRIPFSASTAAKIQRREHLFLDETTSNLTLAPPPIQPPEEKRRKPRTPSTPNSGRNNRKDPNQHVSFDSSPQGPPLPHMAVDARRPQPSALVNRSRITDSVTSAIPDHLSGPTQQRLRKVTSKPFSASDVPGYIYIFSLTNDSPNRPGISESNSNDPNNSPSANPRVLMKIGRAVNVQSRLRQHEKQCNYDLTLIRYYPHIPSDDSLQVDVRKVPNVHRIERLIHLELQDDAKCYPQELKHKCNVCHKIHQEWFSIEASDDGVRRLDELVSRWIEWGEYWGSNDRHPSEDPTVKKKGDGVVPLTPNVLVERGGSPVRYIGVAREAGRRRTTKKKTVVENVVAIDDDEDVEPVRRKRVVRKLFTDTTETAEVVTKKTTRKRNGSAVGTATSTPISTPKPRKSPAAKKTTKKASDDDDDDDDDYEEDASWDESRTDATETEDDDDVEADSEDEEYASAEEAPKKRTPKGGKWRTQGSVKTTGDLWRNGRLHRRGTGSL
ncbi:meiotically up-regulated gene 113-domain-containing protein [Peziza echinospora]|nr:meiotically up-regulated gene 113-domain-containing protein [Peziza echinospora]